VGVIKAVFRAFSYLFHAVLALFLLGVSAVALGFSPQSLHLEMLPWTGSTLAYAVLFGAIFGLVTILLAIAGRLRFLFFLYALAVLILMVRGYFFSGYRFSPGDVKLPMYLIAGALISLIGAWLQMMRSPAGVKRRY